MVNHWIYSGVQTNSDCSMTIFPRVLAWENMKYFITACRVYVQLAADFMIDFNEHVVHGSRLLFLYKISNNRNP